ncbi:MetQ/NlpA family ABC transporter substrate-binding protein [Comamonas sp. JUb58]|uniref:MetQ/NlpA family ABC transporter substrate-binding protein n=1 Tax=Comamonas sp. JUb58 TaxID=2485114 RepID=UPI0010610D38|nr:MetQ/NlpA family ABC transporter substrate-binding protein [Comamonas sp. JUb58]MDR0260169.1 MetQ/NlpA family ABC transporter substrate-binding protein [Comamonas sp.]TDS82769.1 D-methionine transport system substrate-binding protein [Comamonas sp. JUb58]
MQKRTLLQSVLALALAAGVSGAAVAQDKEIKIGVTAGPHGQIMEQVKKIAEKDGLKIKVIEFSDYIQPNAALQSGELDANSYQHKPYLDAQIKDRGYKFVVAADTVNFPIGIYSKKIKKIEELKEGARFGLPNDPTNGGRVLLLLQANGLIKLKESAGLKATPLDVVENPKKLRFVELDAAQLPRSLDDLDAAAINTNFAISAGLNPKSDAIVVENAKNPYVNILVIREADKNQPWVAKLVKAYHSEEIRKFVDTQFKGAVMPGF